MTQTKLIPVTELELNKGQIEGLPKNPKFIRDDNFKKLKKSCERLPVMQALREPIVMPLEKNGKTKYVIIAGNQRFKALKELGADAIACKVLDADTDAEHLKAYTMLDNGNFGRWDYDKLANLFDDEMLELYNVDVSAWQVKEQDFDGAGKELDLDDFDEMMSLKIELLPEQMSWVRAKLNLINASPEQAILQLTGWNCDGVEESNDTLPF